MEQVQGKAGNTGRVLVSITSFRRRLLDPDNLCGKWFLDCLRYCGLISDDRPEDISYFITQEKVKDKAQERTEIVVSTITLNP